MRKTDLSGEWNLYKRGSKKSIPAHVPGCVHADLMAAGEMEDLVRGTRLEAARWVMGEEWVYEKTFVQEDVSAYDRVVLCFGGLNGCAAIRLNDAELGQVTNPFETVEFEVKPLLKAGKNRLRVTFSPPTSTVPGAEEGPNQDFISLSPTVGIGRTVSLLAFTHVRVSEVHIRQDFATAGVVKLHVAVASERYDPAMHLELLVRVCYKGNILHEARDLLNRDRMTLSLTVKNPQLWWPAGLGEQPLYEVTVDVLSGRTCYEHVARRIGLRQVEMEPVRGRAFGRVKVNGQSVFLKGASWVPADLYPARLTRVEYARLVKAVAVANMNCLRVWGGGLYENDAFYDLCDEYGICVWQDLMLGGSRGAPPAKGERASFEREVRSTVMALRHHPCLALWCGGDGGGKAIDSAYTKIAVDGVRAADPDTPCLPPIPHQPFSLTEPAGYMTMPSFPEPRVIAEYLDEGERNAGHPACAFHMSPSDGARRIYHGFLDHFLVPSSFDHVAWLSQIQQAVLLRRAYERVRTAKEASPGFLYWHFNDCWPTCSPSAVDYAGRWKALQYLARRFFAPISLCGVYCRESGTVTLNVFHDGLRPTFKGEMQWRVTQMEGIVVAEGTKKVSVAPLSRDESVRVKVADILKRCGADNLIMWIYLLDEQGNQVAWNTVLFCEPRALKLQAPRMRAEIRAWDDNSFAVTLTSHHPALWVWISLDGMDARMDDNFFSLEPDKPFRVRVIPATRMKLDAFRQILRIGSLRDTWQDKRLLMQVMAAAKKK
ncbi:MAG TPA: hypothetical protein PLJ32_06210 [Kiritimatiellia bacterium]|nr:hypothetical protein [Kiritimatiellia bacterium]HOR98227.1 hypothetical protein [Kiritimatiellia bacterium]HPC49066.1 hypothetical protein [Kiritimatiellia bacterium]HPK36731.1 hypothetical protein [Kiritimatiellia bacterium]HPW75553.1 hypothetical protein [Kiritimatiellia bacterium]